MSRVASAAALRLLPLRTRCRELALLPGQEAYGMQRLALLVRAYAAAAGGPSAEEIGMRAMAGSPAPGILPPNYHRPSPRRQLISNILRIIMPIAGLSCLVYGFTHPDQDPLVPDRYPPHLMYLAGMQSPNTQPLVNWSGTHEATPKRHFEPVDENEVEGLLRAAAGQRHRLRPAGSCLSPNGMGLSGEGMLSMGLMDKIVSVDADSKRVTVQAGARVQQVVEALKPHGLALQNYASIREQQIGGFTQVSAHGTGARIPPVDEQVVGMRLATPGGGVLALGPGAAQEPELFKLARVGLGALGTVTQVTLQCVPRQQLIERTFVASSAEVKRNHVTWLKDNKHLRYMWLPYTDAVVVVTANPPPSGASGGAALEAAQREAASPKHSLAQATEPLRKLFAERAPASDASALSPSLSGPDLRDALLALAPVDKAWVARVNAAEAEFWRRSAGVRVGYADEILGFDCGGQQWVMETCFPVGKLSELKPGSTPPDLAYVADLLRELSKAGVPAPCPIEQRWTCGSSSPLSPAHGPADTVFSWVGIIMYLPSSDPQQRAQVTQAFHRYGRLVEDRLMPRYNAVWHWAKLEPHHDAARPDAARLGRVRERLVQRYGQATLAAVAKYRAALDPTGVLGNDWLEALLPSTTPPGAANTRK